MSFTTKTASAPSYEEQVYVIHAIGTNRYKVGISYSPEARLRQLQTGSPVDLQIVGKQFGNRAVELAIHRKLSAYRSHGEWFEIENFSLEMIFDLSCPLPTSRQAARCVRPAIEPSILSEIEMADFANVEFAQPTGWGKLWRIEKSGNYWKWRLCFSPSRITKGGGRITPAIQSYLAKRPGSGRHAESRLAAERLRHRANQLVLGCSRACVLGYTEVA